MEIWQLATIAGVAIGSLLVSIFIVFKPVKKSQNKNMLISDLAEKDVERVFDDSFREELKNRGRLHFEKIISENAMFLQQDLRLTTSQLNDYMKDEIKKDLKDEFQKYEESINTAKDLALDTIQKTQDAIDQQRTILEKQMREETAKEKQRIIDHFQNNMTDIVNHYILDAIGKEIDLNSQLDYIFEYLEENKQAIVEDIKNGA